MLFVDALRGAEQRVDLAVTVDVDDRQVYGSQQGLHGEESHAHRHCQQLRDVAVGLDLAGDRRTQPNVVRQPSGDDGHHGGHVTDALGKQQPIQIGRVADECEQVGALLWIDSVVEHVRQRCAEHALAASMPRHECIGLSVPAARHGPGCGAGAAARRAWAPVHGLATAEARVAHLGIAVVTARAHLLAAFPGVERVVCPFDLTVLRHCGFHAKSPRGDCQTG